MFRVRKVYIVTSPRFMYRFKVGIAYDVDSRTSSYGVVAQHQIWLPCFDAYEVEQVVRGVYSKWSAERSIRGKVRSGHTEWYWYANVLTAVCVAIPTAILVGWREAVGALALAATPYPIDAILITILTATAQAILRLGRIAVIVCGIYFIYTFTTNYHAQKNEGAKVLPVAKDRAGRKGDVQVEHARQRQPNTNSGKPVRNRSKATNDNRGGGHRANAQPTR